MAKIMQIEFNQTALISLLKYHFLLNLSRIKCLSLFILALIETKSVNLSELKNFFTSKALPDSRNKRLKRFLSQIKFAQDFLAIFLLKIMAIDDSKKLILILDRTNWKFGLEDCNILYLAIAHKGIAIPLFWTPLKDQKRGNSSPENRIKLVQQFINCFGKERIECIMGDREFIGNVWINWLKEKKLPFVMRIKEKGQNISCARGGMVKAERLFDDLKIGESKSLGLRRISESNTYKAQVTGLKTQNNETLILIHCPSIEDPCMAYKERWQIERFFKSIKLIGFNLEETHIKNQEYLNTLLCVVSIAFCFNYKFGDVYIEAEKPKPKKHGYLPKSTTHYGHECLIEIIRKTFFIATEVFHKIFNSLENSLFAKVFTFNLKIVR